METEREDEHYEEEEAYVGEAEIIVPTEQDTEPEEYIIPEATTEQTPAFERNDSLQNLMLIKEHEDDRGGFIPGLSVGLGIGCISTFLIMWITVFFSPQLPSTVTYEALLSVFIYPLVYLLSVGLIALTAGIVREYYMRRRSHN